MHRRPFKRRRTTSQELPFGFDIRPYYEHISHSYGFPEFSHQLSNYIMSFDGKGAPTWRHPDKVWKTEAINGIYAKFEGVDKNIFISGMHTSHTESLYMMAHELRKAIRRQQEVSFIKVTTAKKFKDVDISRALKQQRHKETNVLYLGALHMGDVVVLKTTTDPAMQLKYILDAVIHSHVCNTSPHSVAKLHFVAFHGESLIVCSGQMIEEKSIFSFMNTLKQRYLPDILAFKMVQSFCQAIGTLQQQSGFTHRDCHTSNVYYDSRQQQTKFIDFDWSCVQIDHNIISVPRYLYDTTRPQYGSNNSVDCCVFFRTLGFSLQHVPIFKERIYDPLMRRYEVDSREMLKRKMTKDAAALQLYKMSTDNGKPTGDYAHENGIARYKRNFDYMMGYYTYTSMTPEFISQFLRNNCFF